MVEVVYYSTLIFNFSLSLAMAFIIRDRVKENTLSEVKGKPLHSIIMLPLGAFSGTLLFWGVLDLLEVLGLDITYGHGEIIEAAIVFNFFL